LAFWLIWKEDNIKKYHRLFERKFTIDFVLDLEL